MIDKLERLGSRPSSGGGAAGHRLCPRCVEALSSARRRKMPPLEHRIQLLIAAGIAAGCTDGWSCPSTSCSADRR
jgi:hypothetical protein